MCVIHKCQYCPVASTVGYQITYRREKTCLKGFFCVLINNIVIPKAVLITKLMNKDTSLQKSDSKWNLLLLLSSNKERGMGLARVWEFDQCFQKRRWTRCFAHVLDAAWRRPGALIRGGRSTTPTCKIPQEMGITIFKKGNWSESSN